MDTCYSQMFMKDDIWKPFFFLSDNVRVTNMFLYSRCSLWFGSSVLPAGQTAQTCVHFKWMETKQSELDATSPLPQTQQSQVKASVCFQQSACCIIDQHPNPLRKDYQNITPICTVHSILPLSIARLTSNVDKLYPNWSANECFHPPLLRKHYDLGAWKINSGSQTSNCGKSVSLCCILLLSITFPPQPSVKNFFAIFWGCFFNFQHFHSVFLMCKLKLSIKTGGWKCKSWLEVFCSVFECGHLEQALSFPFHWAPHHKKGICPHIFITKDNVTENNTRSHK